MLNLIKTVHCDSTRYAKVYRDSDWHEYRVKFYDVGARYITGADYHTDDRQDAIDTAIGTLYLLYMAREEIEA